MLDEKVFSIDTDHTSLRTAVKSSHLSQLMVHWLLLFIEYNFVVYYKLGKNNLHATALSHCSNYVSRRDMSCQPNIDDEICVCYIDLGAECDDSNTRAANLDSDR